MYATVGFTVLVFSTAVILVAALFLISGLRGREIRPVAFRLVIMFGVFAVAGGYVWVHGGPSADLRTEVNQMLTLPLPPPAYIWI